MTHLSVSQLDTLTKCGQQWYFRYVEGLRMPPGVRMVIGSAVDGSVNRNLQTKIETDELMPTEAVAETARDVLNEAWSRNGVELDPEEKELGIKKVKGAAIDRSVGLAVHHAEQLAPGLRPVQVQRKFEIDLIGYDTTFLGYIDIDEGTRIRDTKTTRKGKGQVKDDVHISTQLTAYALAKKVIDGKIPKAVKLDFVFDRYDNKRDREPQHETFTARRTTADFQPLLNRVERAIEVIESGAFMPAPPGSWWCHPKWCGYWAVCPWVNKKSISIQVPKKAGGGK